MEFIARLPWNFGLKRNGHIELGGRERSEDEGSGALGSLWEGRFGGHVGEWSCREETPALNPCRCPLTFSMPSPPAERLLGVPSGSGGD